MKHQYDLTIKKAKKIYSPGKDEAKKMNEASKKFLAEASKISKRYCGNPMICGSVAKNTWLPGRNEFDVFILFKESVPRDLLKDNGLKIGKEIAEKLRGKWKIAYAEHPYVQVQFPFKKSIYKVDVVPCYDLKSAEKIKSAVDRTPHHVRYIKSKMKNGMEDEVRLLKQFCIAAGCYGADMKVLGFSGYLCELLILKYGSFLKVVENASEWMPGIVIDIEKKTGKNEKEIFEKYKTPLIVIDPVDKNRNVAAAVSAESFFEFIKNCRDFLKHPVIRMFEPRYKKPYSAKELKKEINRRGSRLYIMEFERPDILDDILWSQMRRALDSIEKILSEGGFRVLRKDCWANEEKCIFLFEMDVWQVPWIVKHAGPNIYSIKQAKAFLEHCKDRRVYIEGDFWISETERKHTVVLRYLDEVFNADSEKLKMKGIPSHLAGKMQKLKIVSGIDAVKEIEKLPKEFGSFIREYFEKNLNVIA